VGRDWWQWQLKWRRVRFELESVWEEDLLRYIAKGALNKESKDYVVWGGDSSGAFSVKSSYASMNTHVSCASSDIFKIYGKKKQCQKHKSLLSGEVIFFYF